MGYTGLQMQVTFWGVRGSHPVPGPDTVRYGGQTSCVEIRAASGARLIVDAGTGLRALGRALAEEQNAGGSPEYHLLLSHVHWDHIQGLPFFAPAYLEDSRIAVYALRAAADEIHHVIAGITRQEFFPTPLDLVPASFSFHEVEPQARFTIGEFAVTPLALNHPFGAVGYRIDGDGTSVAYVCDTAPFTDILYKQHFLPGPEAPSDADRAELARLERELRASLRGADTVIFDTHFLPEEYERFPHYGHATPDHALALCGDLGVRCLVLFHHAPGHHDDLMDHIDRTYRERGAALGLEVVTSRERMTLDVRGEAEE
ncbi:MBL fold metallo-hydrolase [Haliangium sp.]|uniref:MBL fold metallo-hydrolase n=1 Tax=Haliangium sp. TaxID=2663208 RepID=UPI003D0CF3E8